MKTTIGKRVSREKHGRQDCKLKKQMLDLERIVGKTIDYEVRTIHSGIP